METDKLKRCPFCGGEAEVFCACNASPYFTTFRTYCIDCGINIQADSEEEAVEKWNNRPSPWHTGTPTEEGWYLFSYRYLDTIRYGTDCLINGKWVFNPALNEQIIKWQKINEEEKNNG